MIKKLLLAFGLSAFVGIVGFNLIPKPQVIHYSGSIPYAPKSVLINESEVIIRGIVKDILPSKWSNPNHIKGENIRNILQTDVLISISDIFKGTTYDNKKIVVRIDKGKDGQTTMLSDGYPDFNIGEEVILFLSKDDSDVANPNENYYILTGMVQGKFTLDSKTNKEFISAKINSGEKINLFDFKDEIKAEIEKSKKNPKKKMSKEEIYRENEKVIGK